MVEQGSYRVDPHGDVDRLGAREGVCAAHSLVDLVRVELQQLQVAEDQLDDGQVCCGCNENISSFSYIVLF